MFINLNRFKTSRLAKAISSLFLDFTATDTLDERVTFNRTSNATVTRSDGTIGFAPHNLVTFSEQFDNAAWAKTTTTITANNAVAPNGTFTADRIEATADFNSTTLQAFTAIDATYTFSVYLRRVSGLGGISISAGGSFALRTITSTWQRYTVTSTLTAGAVSAGLRMVTNGAVIEMWGAQLEIGSTATTYNPTTVKNLLGFTELFDNAAWTKSNSFIQTNRITFSEQLDNAAWGKAGVTVTANSEIAPNGYQTADTVTNTNGVSSSRITTTPILLPTETYTFTFYVKAGTASSLAFGYFAGAFVSGTASILSGAGSVSGTTLITVSGLSTTEWTRVSFVFVATNGLFFIYPETSSAGTGKSVVLWGAQVVQGSVAGDYRRTDATVLPIYYPNQDGVVVAEKLVENTTLSDHILNGGTPTVGIPQTFSIYAKAAERTKIGLTGAGFTAQGFNAFFDLSNGTIFSNAGNKGAIQDVGNGWYRCSISFSPSNTNAFILNIIDATDNLNYTGNGTSGIYIFGAQLSDSASLDPYVLNAGAAPAAQAYFGARFDYDPVTLQPKGLLIEEQRTNLLLQSEAFDTASWTKTRASATANTTISPDGTQDADKIVEDTTASATHVAIQAASVISGTAYTFSFYLKSAERVSVLGSMSSSFPANSDCIFNASTGIATNVLATSVSMTLVGNGWYRCTMTATANATGSANFALFLRDASSIVYTGNGTSGIFIWGAQLEVGAFATSYIPTQASQVTRAADNATIVGSNFASFYNQNEGALFTNHSGFALSGVVAAFDDNTDNNRIALVRAATSQYQDITIVSGVTQTGGAFGSYTINTYGKTASAYAINNFAYVANGGTVGTDTSALTPITTQFNIGSRRTGAVGVLNGTIKQISYFNRRLSNSELQAITS